MNRPPQLTLEFQALPLQMERHQGFEGIEGLVHGPGHGPQQNDPEVGIIEREIVVADTMSTA